MTVESLLRKYWNSNHFSISIESHDTDPQYVYKQTIFTVGDYDVIENSDFDSAEIITQIDHWHDVPTAIANMEVSEFGVIDEVLIIIVIL